MFPIPFQVVVGVTGLVMASMVVSALVDGARARVRLVRRRHHHPDACGPREGWSDWDSVAEALASGCCVTADAVPMGPIPGFLTNKQAAEFWYERWTFGMCGEGDMAA